MKKSLLVLLAIMLFTTSCSDMFEKQLDIYEDALEELEDVKDFQTLMNEALNTETKISYVIAKTTDEEINELKEDYKETYEQMLDSVETMRKSYYSEVDRIFLGYTYNFVERRILLYQMAADRYCKTEHIEELNAIKEIIKRYSKLSFVESQRSCDPPAKIRDEYEAAKELADNCFDVAKKRIIDKEKEEKEKEKEKEKE